MVVRGSAASASTTDVVSASWGASNLAAATLVSGKSRCNGNHGS